MGNLAPALRKVRRYGAGLQLGRDALHLVLRVDSDANDETALTLGGQYQSIVPTGLHGYCRLILLSANNRSADIERHSLDWATFHHEICHDCQVELDKRIGIRLPDDALETHSESYIGSLQLEKTVGTFLKIVDRLHGADLYSEPFTHI